MKTLYWIVIILSWIFILSSCSQEKCEENLGYQFPYRVEILDSLGNVENVRFAYSCTKSPNDSTIKCVVLYCDNGRLKKDYFYCEIGKCNIFKL